MQNKINWISVVVAMVGGMLIGFLWYGVLFNAQWMAGNGITMEGDKAMRNGVEIPPDTPMILNVIAMAVYALIMNWILGRTNSKGWMNGATVGGMIGLIMAIGVYTGNNFAGSPASLSMIDGSYSLVLFTLIGAIVGFWKK